MKYELMSPCAKCPFRNGIKPFISSARAHDILTCGQEFACHATLDYDNTDEDGIEVGVSREACDVAADFIQQWAKQQRRAQRLAQPAPPAGEPDFRALWLEKAPSPHHSGEEHCYISQAVTFGEIMYRLGQQATRGAPLPEDVARIVKHLRGACQNTAADLIETLARERDEAREDLAKADAVIAYNVFNDACPHNCERDADAALDRHAARQAKPKENG